MIENPKKTTGNKRLFVLVSCMIALAVAQYSCYGQASSSPGKAEDVIYFSVKNHLDQSRENSLIVLDPSVLSEVNFSERSRLRIFLGENEIPSQWNEKGPEKGLAFVLPTIGPSETLELRIVQDDSSKRPDYNKRTQAELSHKFGGEFKDREYIGGYFENVDSLHVPAEHTDHSWFIRYEGPGWESDLVGYRFYLDWRNGIDVFGKKVKSPVLQDVGQDGFDSYHEPAEWGMDVLKVGKTLGLGSIATWENGKARRVDVTDSLYAEITNNGAVYSSVLTNYYGWDLPSGKTDLRAEIAIHAGTRLSKMDLISSNEIPNFATGLIKDPKAELMQSNSDLEFGYIATYGSQSLAGDKLGIAVIYPTSKLKEITEDELSHVLVFDARDQELSYYFLAAWEQEPGGITSKEEFKNYLEMEIVKLSNPLEISIK
ncbi:DUF4861 domain-containing protein [Algoriphagus halophytocola]|uniref:DUF4861 domain-containing protein n=1 Tax=Algoriphagus halophytocola TaxID=2991499 RepID=A0ABY6MLI0_9BACT|nr:MULTISPECIES: DUF4861 domain-containing protein [unclassified Algoriphagus]UZD24528.1 DUF4861 domain-containing protein [Algoriphagus sp. TR-M5]WBL41892.1 DUF4861 domain-containing protein [Algoriphagus sp. TR-M9]